MGQIIIVQNKLIQNHKIITPLLLFRVALFIQVHVEDNTT